MEEKISYGTILCLGYAAVGTWGATQFENKGAGRKGGVVGGRGRLLQAKSVVAEVPVTQDVFLLVVPSPNRKKKKKKVEALSVMCHYGSQGFALSDLFFLFCLHPRNFFWNSSHII